MRPELMESPTRATYDCFSLQAQDDTAIFFSNFATTAADQTHTVAAPGVCVATTSLGGLYGASSGTSSSSPHVAGIYLRRRADRRCHGGDSLSWRWLSHLAVALAT